MAHFSNMPRYRKLLVTVAQDLILNYLDLKRWARNRGLYHPVKKLTVIFLVLWVL